MISLTAYGSVNSRAVFIGGRDPGQSDIDRYLDTFGLPSPRVSIYEKEELEALMMQEEWSGAAASAIRLADAVLASEKRRTVLFPALMRSGSACIGAELKYSVLNAMLAGMGSADLAAVKEAAGVWLPLLAEGQEDPVGAFLNVQDEAWGGKIAPPAVTYGEEIRDTALRPDGTYLVVFETVIPDGEPAAWLDMTLEAVLPTERIPSSVEDADYIIRCHTEYSGGVSMAGVSLHYPYTRITVHDARTGALLRDLGAVHRKLSGTVALPKGEIWWDPLRTELWEKIGAWFEEE